MTLPSAIRTAAAALLAAALAGCAASIHPVGPLSEAVTEPRLVGVWTHEDRGDGDEYLHILPSDDGRRLQIVAVHHGDKSWVALDGYVTAVGDRRLLNLRIAAADAKLTADLEKSGRKQSHPYSFVSYAFEGDDRLSVSYPREVLYHAVKEGRLAGETYGDYDVFVADSPTAIAAILGAVDAAALYADPEHYRRVRPAP